MRKRTSNPSDDLHLSISYLFENMRDVKQDIREVRQDIKELNGRIDGVKDVLLQRLDTRFTLTITTMVALATVIITAVKMDF